MNEHPTTIGSVGPMDPLPLRVMPEDVRRQIEEILAAWAAPPDYPQRPQLCPCPICNGAGSVPAYGTAAFDPCPYCLGARAVLVYPGGTVRPARVTP